MVRKALSSSMMLVLVLFPLVASANAVDVGLNGRAQLGKGLPELLISINEPIAGFEVTLQRSDGKTLHQKGGGKPGVTRRLALQQPEGKFTYTGELVVVFPDRTKQKMPLQFDAELWGTLKMSLDTSKDVDVEGRKVRFRTSRPVVKAKVEVLMDSGAVAFNGEVPLEPRVASESYEVTWPEAEGRVMRIAIQAFDESTYFTGVQLFPWQVDIPHEEVLFDSGKAQVRKDQEAKLEESYGLIAEAVRKFGRLAPLRLYVAGHTDTRGASQSNRALSLSRAKALGTWFRRRGLSIPIFVEGFGEQALMVSTEDETDEPKNRRAEYIIAVEDPVIARSELKASWKKL